MQKLIQHIETLIRRHDYVIVPELGGFILQQNSAKISDYQLMPPLASIGFNSLMNVSDGLLAIEISRMEKISFRQAMQLIEEEVATLKADLRKGNKIECGRIGYFTMSNEDKIVFTPTETYSLLPSNYGLEAIYVAPLTNKIEKDTRKVIQITLPSAHTAIRYAAVVAVAVGVFFTVPKIHNSSLDFAAINPLSVFNKPKKTAVEEIPMTTTTFTIAEPHTESTTAEIEIIEKKVHIIVSCWNTENEANDYVMILKSAGYDKAHVLPSGKLHRVSIASFATADEAGNFIKELKSNAPQFSEAWIYREK